MHRQILESVEKLVKDAVPGIPVAISGKMANVLVMRFDERYLSESIDEGDLLYLWEGVPFLDENKRKIGRCTNPRKTKEGVIVDVWIEV